MNAGIACKTLVLAVLAATVIPAPSAAREPAASSPITPQSDCLVPSQVSDWGVVHDKRLVVKSLGERYYDIELSQSCPKLQRENHLSFRKGFMPVPSNSTQYRICGDMGDAVRLTRGIRGTNNPCPISAIRRIDQGTFDAVFGQDSHSADEILDNAPTVRRDVAAND